MKPCLLIVVFSITMCSSSFCQYYLRGEVKDEKGRLMPNVKINLQSKGNYPFSSGGSGLFGIPTSRVIDTIILMYDGYEVLRKAVETEQYQTLIMKVLPSKIAPAKTKLSSKTINLQKEDNLLSSVLGESYSSLTENAFIDANKYPETGFSLSVDRASYSNVRRFLSNEMKVPPDAVRIEEMLNYFDLRTNKNTNASKNFTCNSILSSCP